jgi:hypothetical protein
MKIIITRTGSWVVRFDCPEFPYCPTSYLNGRLRLSTTSLAQINTGRLLFSSRRPHSCPATSLPWMCAKYETLHREINWNLVNDDEDSEFHEEHEPLDEFKLLGYVGQSLESQENFIAPKGPS